MFRTILFLFLLSCGTDVQVEPEKPGPAPKPGPGPSPGPGTGLQFSDLFNGASGPGDKSCGPCHGGDAFLKSQQGFCSKGLPRVQNKKMPPNGNISDDLVKAMNEVCF